MPTHRHPPTRGEYPNFWVIAGLLVLFGLLALFALGGPDEPECDGREMQPGDECIVVGRGDPDTVTYEEMVERNRGADLAQFAGVLLILAGAGVASFAAARRHPFPGV